MGATSRKGLTMAKTRIGKKGEKKRGVNFSLVKERVRGPEKEGETYKTNSKDRQGVPAGVPRRKTEGGKPGQAESQSEHSSSSQL